MKEFKGTQGKLNIDIFKEDFYVNIANEKGNSVASISTNEEQFKEAICYGKLFASSPELLELCLLVYNSFGGGNVITFSEEDIENFETVINKII